MAEEAPDVPASRFAKAKVATSQLANNIVDGVSCGASKVLDAVNFQWVNLHKMPSAVALLILLVVLALCVGLTAVPVKNGVTLGVEFGGGYQLRYECYQKPGGPPVTPDAVTAQAKSMYIDCVNAGYSNCVVQYYQPRSINVVIPGVSTSEEISPVLDAFAQEPLGLKLTFSLSLSGVLGSSDLTATITAACIAFGVVWGVLLLRYLAAGALALYLTVVFSWLVLIFFNASPSVLSEAAFVAFVLNIALSADAHILTFECARQELHTLPKSADREECRRALLAGTRSATITILKANTTTIICMFVMYFVGVGPVADYALMVLISVATSILVNVILARLFLQLAWSAGVIETGAVFGDKGPQYDDEQAKTWWTANYFWRPRRNISFDFISIWWVGVGASLIVITVGCVFLAHQDVLPLNFDIDFTSGTALDLVLTPGNYTCDDLSSTAEDTGPSVATCALASDRSSGHAALRFDDVLGSEDVQAIVTAMEDAYGAPVAFTEITVDPSVAITMVHHGIKAICISAVVVALVVWLRFDLAAALSGGVAMASSGIFSLCCFAMGGYEIDVTFVAAEPLRAFSLAITFGLVSAAYTTILIVAPMYNALSLGGMALSARMLARTQSQKDSTPDDDSVKRTPSAAQTAPPT